MKRYDLVLVVGNRGHGKTTWVAQYIKRELQSKIFYKRGLANIHYKLSPEIEYTNYAGIRLLDQGNEEGQPEIVVHIDQIHKYFDGRRASSNENLEFWDTLVESRQHGFDVVGTTWAYSAVDPRLRKFANLIVECKRGPTGFLYDYFDNDEKRFISPPNGFEIRYAEAAKWWKFFNTGELVNDNTLNLIAEADEQDKPGLTKRVAKYEPCGEKSIAAK